MNKHEYLEELTHQLRGIPDDEIERARAFYSESIDDRREEGLSEQEAVASLESPVEAAQRIISELPTRPRATANYTRKKPHFSTAPHLPMLTLPTHLCPYLFSSASRYLRLLSLSC